MNKVVNKFLSKVKNPKIIKKLLQDPNIPHEVRKKIAKNFDEESKHKTNKTSERILKVLPKYTEEYSFGRTPNSSAKNSKDQNIEH